MNAGTDLSGSSILAEGDEEYESSFAGRPDGRGVRTGRGSGGQAVAIAWTGQPLACRAAQGLVGEGDVAAGCCRCCLSSARS